MGTPALLDAQSAKVLSAVNQSSSAFYRRVVQGALLTDNGSATSGWDATLTFDMTRAIISSLSGAFEVAAATASSMTTTFGNGASATSGFASIVADNSSGTPAFDAQWTADGASEALTDAEISDALGHHDWVRICDVTVAITGATTGTYGFDNTVASGIVAAGFDGGLATSEDAFNG
jgi:hypothetical protein